WAQAGGGERFDLSAGEWPRGVAAFGLAGGPRDNDQCPAGTDHVPDLGDRLPPGRIREHLERVHLNRQIEALPPGGRRGHQAGDHIPAAGAGEPPPGGLDRACRHIKRDGVEPERRDVLGVIPQAAADDQRTAPHALEPPATGPCDERPVGRTSPRHQRITGCSLRVEAFEPADRIAAGQRIGGHAPRRLRGLWPAHQCPRTAFPPAALERTTRAKLAATAREAEAISACPSRARCITARAWSPPRPVSSAHAVRFATIASGWNCTPHAWLP